MLGVPPAPRIPSLRRRRRVRGEVRARSCAAHRVPHPVYPCVSAGPLSGQCPRGTCILRLVQPVEALASRWSPNVDGAPIVPRELC